MNRRMKMKRLKQELKETKWELDLYKSHTQNTNVSYSKPEIRKSRLGMYLIVLRLMFWMKTVWLIF